MAVLLSAAAKAASADTIHAEQFGILPYTYENQTFKMQEALRACKEQGAKVLAFRDNTVTYSPEVKNQPKLFLLNGCKDVSIEKNQFPTPLAKEQTQTSNMP